MADWGYALSQGIGRAAETGVGLIDMRMKKQDQIEAEERAADRKLSDAERLLAIQEAMKNRAAERFSAIYKGKLGEQVPVEPEQVTRTTSEGAKAAGLQDGLINMTREQVAAYKDPDMLAQYDKQMAEDKRLAAEKVEGKTRPRTQDEAIKAALNEALANDPAAFVAGHAMTASDQKEKLEERKLASKEKIEQMRIEQRDRSDDKRFEAMMARIEALGNKDGKGGGDKTALIQNAEYLRSLGYSDDKIEKFIFEKKEVPLEDLAAKIYAEGSKNGGEMTPEQAAQRAISLRNALSSATKHGGQIAPSGDRPPLSSFMKVPSRESSGKIKQ